MMSFMRVISENIANADSTAQRPDGDPFRRRIPTFRSAFDRALDARVVSLGKIKSDSSDFRVKYEPGHPNADASGNVKYPNINPLVEMTDMIGATAAGEVRPVERVFISDPGVSEAVYRLLRAAREGRRLQEEVRVGSHKGEPGRWLRMRVRPLRDGKRATPMTVWSLSDVTRELERQENVFQELQHAIDYLDHAPAGFFSVDADGNMSYLNATLAEWLDHGKPFDVIRSLDYVRG